MKIRRREPSGKAQRPAHAEREAEIIQLAVRNRARDYNLKPEECRDQRAGSKLGYFRITRQIDEDQYEAGLRWERLVRRHRAVEGSPSPSPRSASFVMVANGVDGSETLDAEAQIAVRREWNDAVRALTEYRDGGAFYCAMALIENDMWPNLGDLRCGLNILHRLWR